MNKIVSLFCLILLVSQVFAQKRNDLSFDLPIYKTDTIIWFGADFSFLRLTNESKVGEEEKNRPLIPVWIEGYAHRLSNVKLASLLGVKRIINDKEYTDHVYESVLPKVWIIKERHKITESEIKDHLKDYKSENKGIGLVYIVENFFKGDKIPGTENPSVVHGYFVWFDIKTKDVIAIQTIDGAPSIEYYDAQYIVGTKDLPRKAKGMVGYWLQGMIDATVAFSIDYKSAIPKEEKQY